HEVGAARAHEVRGRLAQPRGDHPERHHGGDAEGDATRVRTARTGGRIMIFVTIPRKVTSGRYGAPRDAPRVDRRFLCVRRVDDVAPPVARRPAGGGTGVPAPGETGATIRVPSGCRRVATVARAPEPRGGEPASRSGG